MATGSTSAARSAQRLIAAAAGQPGGFVGGAGGISGAGQRAVGHDDLHFEGRRFHDGASGEAGDGGFVAGDDGAGVELGGHLSCCFVDGGLAHAG